MVRKEGTGGGNLFRERRMGAIRFASRMTSRETSSEGVKITRFAGS